MMLEQLLIQLGKLAIGSLITFGPLMGLIVLLNLRDRRELSLSFVVHKQLNSPDLRGLIAVKTLCGIFSQWSVVVLDICTPMNEKIWDGIMRLSHSLPPRVRLIVRGTLSDQFITTFNFDIKTSEPNTSTKSSVAPAGINEAHTALQSGFTRELL